MDIFSLRRAVERLRDGLFDLTAVDCLTMKSEQVINGFFKGLKALERGQPSHLCICGSYGQGKSHNLNYLHSEALAQGYAASFVQLDLREIPLHRFSIVYQSLMEKLSLPNGQSFVEAWKQFASQNQSKYVNFMPHRFQMILQSMISKSRLLDKKQKEKQLILKPKEVAGFLERALMGRDISLSHFKQILKSSDIEGYKKEPLVSKGNAPYIQMIQALGGLLKEMGYKGLVLFFDEAEAIAQGHVNSRAKSYDILHQFFDSREPVYAIFAFTEFFFDKINLENYTDEKKKFPQNYAELWKSLNVVRLEESSSKEWDSLLNRLIQLYANAYQIDLSPQIAEIKEKLKSVLSKINAQETRFKLKALVHQLDIETQNHFLGLASSY